MTTTKSKIVQPDLPPLPRVTRSMVFKHFGPNAGRDLLRTEWKDGIDLEVATYALQCFAEDYAAAAVLAERERCAMKCESEHVGESVNDDRLVSGDMAYNTALRHAAAAIRAEPKEQP